MSSEDELEETQVQEVIENIFNDEMEEGKAVSYARHCSKSSKPAKKGKNVGKEVVHFHCNYCKGVFQGPGSSTFLVHLRQKHPSSCPELLTKSKSKINRGFFDKIKMRQTYNEDIFMGKLLTWIVKSDQPFTIVDNKYFEDLLEYLKQDVTSSSRRTIMRRLEEMYNLKRNELKERLNGFTSKYSITCDVWTSKNQLSFFGFTIHYIDNNWKMQEGLLAFKHLDGEHDGLNLSKAMIEVLEEYGIAERLLGVTADNASNNSTMMVEVEKYYHANYPSAGFSVSWNQIECMAHVINLGAQQILLNFKQHVDYDDYEPESISADRMVTAVSRLSFLARKIRLSPKLRRLMEKICKEKDTKYLVPIIDVRTRWNSTYDMLVRAMEYKDILSDTFYNHKDNALIKLLLDADDWKCIEQLTCVLSPLKKATLMVSKGGESLMITNVLPIYNACTGLLTESLDMFNNDDDIFIGIEAALEKLNHYYDKISPIVGIALILNPTKKQNYFKAELGWKKSWVDIVTDQFYSAFRYYKALVNVQESSNHETKLMMQMMISKIT